MGTAVIAGVAMTVLAGCGAGDGTSARVTGSTTTAATQSEAPPVAVNAAPGEECGTHTYAATGTVAGIYVVEGSMTCADATALVDRYFTDSSLVRQGNTESAMFDGWTCASPTAVAAQAAGYSTQCTNDAKGVTIQLVPNR